MTLLTVRWLQAFSEANSFDTSIIANWEQLSSCTKTRGTVLLWFTTRTNNAQEVLVFEADRCFVVDSSTKGQLAVTVHLHWTAIVVAFTNAQLCHPQLSLLMVATLQGMQQLGIFKQMSLVWKCH